VLELYFRAVKFLFFPRQVLNPHAHYSISFYSYIDLAIWIVLCTFYFSFAFFLCIDVSMNELRTLTLKKWRKPLKTPWKDLEFLGQKRVGTLYKDVRSFSRVQYTGFSITFYWTGELLFSLNKDCLKQSFEIIFSTFTARFKFDNYIWTFYRLLFCIGLCLL
jgi:hypothetical protein